MSAATTLHVAVHIDTIAKAEKRIRKAARTGGDVRPESCAPGFYVGPREGIPHPLVVVELEPDGTGRVAGSDMIWTLALHRAHLAEWQRASARFGRFRGVAPVRSFDPLLFATDGGVPPEWVPLSLHHGQAVVDVVVPAGDAARVLKLSLFADPGEAPGLRRIRDVRIASAVPLAGIYAAVGHTLLGDGVPLWLGPRATEAAA